MVEYSDIPTVCIEPIAPGAELRADVLGRLCVPAHVQERVEREWGAMCAENPRLHDGEVLLVERGVGAGELAAQRASFKVLAAGARAGVRVRALGVQGLLVGRDKRGDPHVLLGRRGSDVRIYAGLWENAPSGTIEPPPDSATTSFGMEHVLRTFHKEGVEELGIDLEQSKVSWTAMLEDAEAASNDVVLRVELDGTIDPLRTACAARDGGRWEYADTAWVAMREVGEWVGRNGDAVSPPTRALLRWESSRAHGPKPK